MNRTNRAIALAAVFGLIATALAALYVHLVGDFSGGMLDVIVLICPAGLLGIPFQDLMQNRIGFCAIWLFIGFLNAGIYAVVAAAIGGLIRKD